MEKKSTAPVTNSSTRHVLEALRIIARSETPLGLKEIAEELDLPPSTAHRALMTLEESGFSTRTSQSARFFAGDILDHLVHSMVAQFPARKSAAPTMRDISAKFDVSTTLNWRLGWSSIRLASYDGKQDSFQRRRIGEIRPLHDGVGPATILMRLTQEERHRYLAAVEAGESDQSETVNKARFTLFQEQMADQGYLELPPKDDYGFHWISTPLLRPDGFVCGSLSAGLPVLLRDEAKLQSDIAGIRKSMAEFQDFLNTDAALTQSHFVGLGEEEFLSESSPKRWITKY